MQAADAAWTEAIMLAPTNAPALSNRGTVRLQAGAETQSQFRSMPAADI